MATCYDNGIKHLHFRISLFLCSLIILFLSTQTRFLNNQLRSTSGPFPHQKQQQILIERLSYWFRIILWLDYDSDIFFQHFHVFQSHHEWVESIFNRKKCGNFCPTVENNNSTKTAAFIDTNNRLNCMFHAPSVSYFFTEFRVLTW